MWKIVLLAFLAFAQSSFAAFGQIKRTSVPMGDAINRALTKISLTSEGARPFHIRLSISEPSNSASPYQGTIEEWWVSPDQWRRVVTAKGGLQQTIVLSGGKKTERDKGDYFPLWLRSFVTAIFDPIPNAAAWTASGAMIEQITMPNGAKSDGCARAQSKIGSGDRATDAFSNVCFDGEGRLKSVVGPRYSMEFSDYRNFARKQVARKLVDHPEPGTELVGEVQLLEDEPQATPTSDTFTPLGVNEDRFRSAIVSTQQMEQLAAGNPPITWPSVRSGNVRGHLAMYLSVDSEGRVREAWPLNSDNAGLEDPAREQVSKWKMKPAIDEAGQRVQVDGGVGFTFETKIEDPLPVITGALIESQASGCNYDPVLPSGLLPKGTSFKIRVSVDEHGRETGESFPDGIPWDVVQRTGLNTGSCHFKPYLVNGRPSYYHIDFVFTAP